MVNKKLIISKTVTFIFVVLFVIAFRGVFGMENTLIGVATITAALMLLERDFTLAPFRVLIAILGLNLFLGVASYLASSNIGLGVIFNFLAIFIVGFLLSCELENSIFLPFGLQYLFMISVPINSSQLGLRLSSLIFGALIIMIIHMVCNSKRLSKSGNILIDKLLCDLIKKIELLRDNKELTQIDLQISIDIGNLKKAIYNKRKSYFYLPEGGRVKLNIVATIKFLDAKINRLMNESSGEVQTQKLNIIYDMLVDIYNCKTDIKALELYITRSSIDGLNDTKIKDNLDILCRYLIKLNQLEAHNYISYEGPVPSEYRFLNIMRRNFNTGTLRFSYAFRVAICVTISLFVMDYFKLPEGRWMAFTVFSLVQPYSEILKDKSQQRMKGTILGGLIFAVVFGLVEDPNIRSLIILVNGYINGFVIRYDLCVAGYTISALGVASITSSIGYVLFYRILFVALGVVLSLIVNKVILPYSIKDAHRDLISMGDHITKKLYEELRVYILKGDKNYSIENLFMISAMIDNKLKESSVRDCKETWIKNMKIIDSIYEVYMWAENDKAFYNEIGDLVRAG